MAPIQEWKRAMSETAPFSKILKFSELPSGRVYDFALEPDASARAAVADTLGVPIVRKLRFVGKIAPLGRRDWQLTARLGATVVQECVTSFQPVTTRIDEDVTRSYLAEIEDIAASGEEMEMPEDDTAEALPAELDLGDVMIEALALALPDYPRAEGIEPLNQSYSAPGTTPLQDEDTKPFAGLASLRDKFAKDS